MNIGFDGGGVVLLKLLFRPLCAGPDTCVVVFHGILLRAVKSYYIRAIRGY